MSIAVALVGVTPTVIVAGATSAGGLTSSSISAPYASDATATSTTCTSATPATTACTVSAAADRSAGALRVAAAVTKGSMPDGPVGATAQADIMATDRLLSSATSATYTMTLDVQKASAIAAAVSGRAGAELAVSITAAGPCAGNRTCSRTTTRNLAPVPPTSGVVTIGVKLEAADGYLLDAGNVDLRISLAAMAAADGTTEITTPAIPMPCGGGWNYLLYLCERDYLPDYSSTDPNYRASGEAVGAATIKGIIASYDRRPLAPRGPWPESIESAIKVIWEQPASPLPVSAYRVYRDDTFVGEVAGNTLSFVDTTVTNGLSYRYSVAAVNAEGEGARGRAYYAVAAMGRPSSPTDAAAEPYACASATTWEGSERVDSRGGAVLRWRATPDVGRPVQYFVIRRGTSPIATEPVAWVHGSSISGLSATVLDCNVPAPGTYYYNVTAQNGVGTSEPSATVAVVVPAVVDPTGSRPKPPQNVSATAASPTSIRVAWSPPPPEVTPVVRYRVYRSYENGYEVLQATLNSDQTAWTDTSYLGPGQTRSYVVRAENLDGEGDRSVVVSATTPTTLPSAVWYFRGSGGAGPRGNQVQLDWGAAGDGGTAITAYRIYRGTAAGNTTVLKSVGGSTYSYLDSNVTRGKTYYYRITAVNANGEGPSSATISVTA